MNFCFLFIQHFRGLGTNNATILGLPLFKRVQMYFHIISFIWTITIEIILDIFFQKRHKNTTSIPMFLNYLMIFSLLTITFQFFGFPNLLSSLSPLSFPIIFSLCLSFSLPYFLVFYNSPTKSVPDHVSHSYPV